MILLKNCFYKLWREIRIIKNFLKKPKKFDFKLCTLILACSSFLVKLSFLMKPINRLILPRVGKRPHNVMLQSVRWVRVLSILSTKSWAFSFEITSQSIWNKVSLVCSQASWVLIWKLCLTPTLSEFKDLFSFHPLDFAWELKRTYSLLFVWIIF